MDLQLWQTIAFENKILKELIDTLETLEFSVSKGLDCNFNSLNFYTALWAQAEFNQV